MTHTIACISPKTHPNHPRSCRSAQDNMSAERSTHAPHCCPSTTATRARARIAAATSSRSRRRASAACNGRARVSQDDGVRMDRARGGRSADARARHQRSGTADRAREARSGGAYGSNRGGLTSSPEARRPRGLGASEGGVSLQPAPRAAQPLHPRRQPSPPSAT